MMVLAAQCRRRRASTVVSRHVMILRRLFGLLPRGVSVPLSTSRSRVTPLENAAAGAPRRH